jgi:uncharacterized protein (DUF1684 family)
MIVMRLKIYLSVLIILILFNGCQPASVEETFAEGEQKWRQQRHERLVSDNSWLTVAGLHWLREGEIAVGAAPDNDIVFPAHSFEPYAFVLVRSGQSITLITGDQPLLLNGKPAPRQSLLKSDADTTADKVSAGDVTFWIVKRGNRFGVRVQDKQAKTYLDYKSGKYGLDFYPPDPAFRVVATLKPYDKPQPRTVATVIDWEDEMMSPGLLHFDLKGKNYTLEPYEASDGRLFIVFKDKTSGPETYGAGRFLYAEKIAENNYDLNFNRAYNPPCAFTRYATCPLPPAMNNLDVAIPAGEKNYHGQH